MSAVLNIRHAPARKVGGRGVCYTVRIGREVTYLFFDGERWFVEEKIPGEFPGR